jgi:hypothetical protein
MNGIFPVSLGKIARMGTACRVCGLHHKHARTNANSDRFVFVSPTKVGVTNTLPGAAPGGSRRSRADGGYDGGFGNRAFMQSMMLPKLPKYAFANSVFLLNHTISASKHA